MSSFAQTCRTDFAFLVERHGFKRTISEGDRDSSASFIRTDAHIGVHAEAGGMPWVTVTVGGRDFGLEKAIKRLDPAYRKARPAHGETPILVYYAHFLRKHFTEILGPLPRRPPPPPPPAKRRATRAGALDFLAALPGWQTGSLRDHATRTTTLIFHQDGNLRVRVELRDGKLLEAVRISAKTKDVDLDDAIAVLAPDLRASRPEEQKARLAYYAGFLRNRGAALLAGKRSAWGKLR